MANKEIYRPNVAIIILNKEGKSLWCRRKQHDGWQFPQGGIDDGETPLEAVLRETEEEVGLKESEIKISIRSLIFCIRFRFQEMIGWKLGSF